MVTSIANWKMVVLTWENHRTTMGQCWFLMGFYGALMGFYGMLPLVNVYITMERFTMLLMGKLTINGLQYFEYMLNYRRVSTIEKPMKKTILRMFIRRSYSLVLVLFMTCCPKWWYLINCCISCTFDLMPRKY